MMSIHGWIKRCSILGAMALQLSACWVGSPTEVELDEDAEMRVVFVGNSLTAANNLPLLVQTIAEATGHTFASVQLTANNFSLEDHWFTGAGEHIRDLEPDIVILQQGPSSLPDNQVYLREWADTLDRVAKEVGGRSALFMVWPEEARRYTAFDAVRQSYSDAAEAVNGIFIPAGEAWRELWSRDSDAPLYSIDGFHPSYLGSLVAALTIHRTLFEEPVSDLPSTLTPTSAGLPPIVLDPAQAAQVYEAVDAAVDQWGRR